ncbi:hypothetical protein E2C01_019781 [Portunus trituberculatus]|uniref:Uncharacterized protein n=1 Tax=Portunus trituberculatus TaxID=210409 RepID=A0A5B7DZL3_PORTR|nr:hypothetical protein [Portunus trituberculatus]
MLGSPGLSFSPPPPVDHARSYVRVAKSLPGSPGAAITISGQQVSSHYGVGRVLLGVVGELICGRSINLAIKHIFRKRKIVEVFEQADGSSRNRRRFTVLFYLCRRRGSQMGTQMPTVRPDTRGLPSCFLIGHNAFLGQPCTEEEEEQRGMRGREK